MKTAKSQDMVANSQTLAGLFHARVTASPEATAYLGFDEQRGWMAVSWSAMVERAARFQAAFIAEGLVPGDRVGIMAKNGCDWVAFDVAAQGLGLVTVPFYTEDRGDNVAWICRDADVKLLLVAGRTQMRRLAEGDGLPSVRRIVCLEGCTADGILDDPRISALVDWLPETAVGYRCDGDDPEALATIVYTSGTTGRPKGVMLTHRNILTNARACAACADFGPSDLFLSFLPLSHMLERTAGLYLPMLVGARVAFARSIIQLAEDLATLRPTVLISVPRIYERLHARIHDRLDKGTALARRLFSWTVAVGWRRFLHAQGRAGWSPLSLAWPILDVLVARKLRNRLGGRLRYAVCGGAALAPELAREFLGLGLPVYQGYGLTESGPVVSVNRPGNNVPASVGPPLPDVEVRIADDGEVLVRSLSVMRGYWNNEDATRAAIDGDGFLHTGDLGRLDADGRLYLYGRLKEIIVLSSGEKVPPCDIEMAIALDPLVEQIMVAGEGRPGLVALVVPERGHWAEFVRGLGQDPAQAVDAADRNVERALLTRLNERLAEFPGYARLRRALVVPGPWAIEDGLLTPTMKLKRGRILERYRAAVDALYSRL